MDSQKESFGPHFGVLDNVNEQHVHCSEFAMKIEVHLKWWGSV